MMGRNRARWGPRHFRRKESPNEKRHLNISRSCHDHRHPFDYKRKEEEDGPSQQLRLCAWERVKTLIARTQSVYPGLIDVKRQQQKTKPKNTSKQAENYQKWQIFNLQVCCYTVRSTTLKNRNVKKKKAVPLCKEIQWVETPQKWFCLCYSRCE